MRSHEQEDYFPDDQNASQTEESTVDYKKRNTLRVVLGALATGVGAFGTYKGEEFISNLIVQKDEAVRDAKKAQLALESQTQEKDTLLLAYKERAYDDTMLVLVESFYPAPLGKALDKIDSNKSLHDPLKRAMLVPEYESRTDAFLRMHQVAKIFIDDHFPQEKDLDKNTLTDVLAYMTPSRLLCK